MDDFEATLKQLNKEWNDAGYKESVIREFAFLDITQDICGVEVKQLTPLHFIYLDFLNSPFINPRDDISPGDVYQFLYVVSTEYRKNDKQHYEEFVKRFVDIDLQKTIDEICQYIQEAFLDSPPATVGPKSNHRPYTAWIVEYIHMIASEYGWVDEYILNLPFTRIFQYIKIIDVRRCIASGQKPVQFNKFSDAAKAKLTAHLQKKAESEGKTLIEEEI